VRSSRKGTLKAPLIVFLSGLFGNLDDSVARNTVDAILSAQVHILAFPNPWSPSYREGNPSAKPGQIETEAKVVREALRRAIARIGPENISQVSLVAVSYGAFLGTSVAALDERSERPLIDGTVTLFSPPLDLSAAGFAFDRGFKRYQELASCQKRSLLSYYWDYYRARNDHDLTAQDRDCADYLLFGEFHDYLVQLARQLHEQDGVGEIPDPVLDPAAYRRWQLELTFKKFATEFLQESIPDPDHLPPDRQWATWAQRLTPALRTSRLRVFASQDDFLNLPGAWSAKPIQAALPSEALLLIDWGGHYGYSQLSEFKGFLSAIL
jgi:hypothetical protein